MAASLQRLPPTAPGGGRVVQHYARQWGDPEEVLRWTAGPVEVFEPPVYVLRYRRASGMDVHATCGFAAQERAAPVEFFLVSHPRQVDEQDAWIVEALTIVGHFHVTGAALDVGHTVNLGRPWLPGSRCSHFLVSLPYLDGPQLEWGPGNEFRCLWLVPVTRSEVEFKKTHGVARLEELIELTGVDYADRLRPSVVGK